MIHCKAHKGGMKGKINIFHPSSSHFVSMKIEIPFRFSCYIECIKAVNKSLPKMLCQNALAQFLKKKCELLVIWLNGMGKSYWIHFRVKSWCEIYLNTLWKQKRCETSINELKKLKMFQNFTECNLKAKYDAKFY